VRTARSPRASAITVPAGTTHPEILVSPDKLTQIFGEKLGSAAGAKAERLLAERRKDLEEGTLKMDDLVALAKEQIDPRAGDVLKDAVLNPNTPGQVGDAVVFPIGQRPEVLKKIGSPRVAEQLSKLKVQEGNIGRDVSALLQKSMAAGDVTPEEVADVLPTLVAYVWIDTGKMKTLGQRQVHVLDAAPSFGYFVSHDGRLTGWNYRIQGPNVHQLSPNLYKISLAPGADAKEVLTQIRACEMGDKCDWPPPPQPDPFRTRPFSVRFELGAVGPRTSHSTAFGMWGGSLAYQISDHLALEGFLGKSVSRDWSYVNATGAHSSVNVDPGTMGRLGGRLGVNLGELQFLLGFGPQLLFGGSYGTVAFANLEAGFEARPGKGWIPLYVGLGGVMPLNTSKAPVPGASCSSDCPERYRAGHPLGQIRVGVGLSF
jgi:hypothetical protein